MSDVHLEQLETGIARIRLARPPVNALNAAVIADLRAALAQANADPNVRAIIFTGHQAFFSFGLDVPEIYPLTPAEFAAFITNFTSLCRELFAAPKPVIAAINGHATAGGCMLAIACEHRVMAEGKAKIGLNEVRFGAGLFAGVAVMLRRIVGARATDRLAQLGEFLDALEGQEIGLVDVTCPPSHVQERAAHVARQYLKCDAAALAQIRHATRVGALMEIDAHEAAAIRTFVDVWYSPETRAQVKRIVIRKHNER